MMTQPGTEQDAFQTVLEKLYEEVLKSDSLQKIRTKAWDHFLELGLPSRKSEVFRYVRLRHFYAHSYSASQSTEVTAEVLKSHIYPECQGSVIVFVNGHFSRSLSQLSPKLVLCSLSEASRTYGTFLNNQWAKSLKEETDPFAALNTALHRDGAFLYIPPKTVLDQPIQVLHLIDTQDRPMFLMPRLHIFVGGQSQVEILSTQAILSGNSYGINQVVDFAIEEEAHVQYSQIIFDEPEDLWHFEALRAVLKRNSTLKTVNATNGSGTVRNDYRVALTGENAEALLNGIWMLKDQREAHCHVLMDHQAPYCRSLQLFKGILDDNSHSSFEGKILVRQPAQKTEAFQLNNNLLLSDRAMAESKPNLEIFADDVKASHGATVGQLDKEQLFYMKTRGFSNQEAKKFLVFGFCQEVIDKISLSSVREEMINRLRE
jgi:Fe-S cluster assembly protein SufD